MEIKRELKACKEIQPRENIKFNIQYIIQNKPLEKTDLLTLSLQYRHRAVITWLISLPVNSPLLYLSTNSFTAPAINKYIITYLDNCVSIK